MAAFVGVDAGEVGEHTRAQAVVMFVLTAGTEQAGLLLYRMEMPNELELP
jgi:hypothetical protein